MNVSREGKELNTSDSKQEGKSGLEGEFSYLAKQFAASIPAAKINVDVMVFTTDGFLDKGFLHSNPIDE